MAVIEGQLNTAGGGVPEELMEVEEIQHSTESSIETESAPQVEESVVDDSGSGGDGGSDESEDITNEPAAEPVQGESEDLGEKRKISVKEAESLSIVLTGMGDHVKKLRKQREKEEKMKENAMAQGGGRSLGVRLPKFRGDAVERDIRKVNNSLKRYIRDNKHGRPADSVNLKHVNGIMDGVTKLTSNPSFSELSKSEENKGMTDNLKQGFESTMNSIKEANPALAEAIEKVAKAIEKLLKKLFGKGSEEGQASGPSQE